MKVYVTNFILLLAFLFAPCNRIYGQQTQISVAYEQEKIETILLDLAAEYQYDIVFHQSYFKDHPLVTITKDQVPIQEVLEQLLENSKVEFRIQNQEIRLIKMQTIFGYIKDELTHEGLINATVYHPQLQKGTYTNEYGYFSLTLPYEAKKLSVQYIGYESKEVSLVKNGKPLAVLLKSSIELAEIIVTQETATFQNNPASKVDGQDILPSQIRAYLGSGGEPDINQHLIRQAGVSSGPDGLGGLHVRGGNSDQNLILLDGVRIFQPNHTFGLFSIFNTPLLKNANFSKYDFHPKNTGGISSVLEMTLKEGSTKKWNGNVSLSTLASQLSANGPIIKDKTSLLFSFRRSHIDEFIKTRTAKQKEEERNEKGATNLFFYDMHLKLHHIIGRNDKLYLSYYRGKDKYDDKGSFDDSFQGTSISSNYINNLNWSNQTTALKWNHLFGDKLFSSAILSLSHFDYQSKAESNSTAIGLAGGIDFSDSNKVDLLSDNREIGFRYDIEHYPSERIQNSLGISYHHTRFIPGALKTIFFSGMDSLDLMDIEDLLSANRSYQQQHLAIYANRKMTLHPKVNLIIGGKYGLVNAENLQENTSSRFHLWHARVALSYTPNQKILFRLSGSKNDQALHLLTSADLGFPSDIWVPSIGRIKPQTAWQGNLFFRYLLNENLTIKSSLFYKGMKNLVRYPSNISLPSISDNNSFWETELVLGKGTAKGWETIMDYTQDKFALNLTYTLSDYQRRFKALEEGNKFPFTFNQRHNLSITANYKATDKLSFYVNFIFNSGSHQTLYSSNSNYSPLDFFSPTVDAQESSINGDRLPAYHRLDVGIMLRFGKSVKQELTLGVQNVYNRDNTYFQYNITPIIAGGGMTGEKRLEQIHTLPILPLIRYSLSF